jgi:CDP-glycerol glycerophosphotransferase
VTDISIIIPVYGVAGLLPGCLDSVLTEADLDIEVIAVDDASPDGCGAILDARAAADTRLRVVHLDRNGGQGAARNLALNMAAGEYVWFVDGDDRVADGGLQAIAKSLAACRGQQANAGRPWVAAPGASAGGPGTAPGAGTVRPDVLLIDWVGCFPDGRSAPNPGAGLLAGVPADGCTLEQQPGLIQLTMTSWSKLFRRDFLRGLGVSFAGGIHEDILVTCAALLEASAIGAVDQVCYSYRRDRKGSALATTSHAHFGVFTAYENVFALLASRDATGRPVSDRLRAAIFERAIWHYTTVLQTTGPGIGRVGLPGLVPRAERHDFFRRMHDDFQRCRPDSYRHPAGARGAKLRLVERGAYWTYSVLEPLNQARVAVRKLAAKTRG